MTRVPGMREAIRRASIAGAALAMLSGIALAGSFASADEYKTSDRGFTSSSVAVEGPEGDRELADADDGLPAARGTEPLGFLGPQVHPRDDVRVTRFVPMARSRGPPLGAAVNEMPSESGWWGIRPYPQNG